MWRLGEWQEIGFSKLWFYLEAVSNTNTEKSSNDEVVSKAFKEQLESHVEQLKKQVKDLRDENDKQQKKVHELIEYHFLFNLVIFYQTFYIFVLCFSENQSTKIAYEKLQNDNTQMKKTETETTAKLNELAYDNLKL